MRQLVVKYINQKIGVTLNIYTHLKFEDAQKEVKKIVSIEEKERKQA